ncbi:low molecular weight protein tyrosine phosphatase family protein [Rubritalea sp.]|uniref:low molecular weight protein tyrosine phosphatase family protein n=1 Tax=Rubritalea sp. TaxID=2109375 RepID=UPI003EF9ED50
MVETFNILFICGKNQWRSPTAEKIYQNDQRFSVRSAGLSKVAKRHLSAKDLEWADLVFVMEREQKRRIAQEYTAKAELPEISCLDIPDIYPYMNEELIELLQLGVESELSTWDY